MPAGSALEKDGGVHVRCHEILRPYLSTHRRALVVLGFEHSVANMSLGGGISSSLDAAVAGAVADEVLDARHRPVVVHDLADHAGGVQAGEAGQVDGGLGVAGPLEHAPLPVAQGEDVAGADEILGGADARLQARR